MKTLIKIVKWLGLGVAFGGQLTMFIPADYSIWGVIAIGAASALKDTLYKIGDQLDNGKQDNSLEV